MIQPHSSEWYDRLSQLQDGYFYPWKIYLVAIEWEMKYLQMARQLLAPEMVVLDVGCWHGEVPIQLARLCQWMVAYDRTTSYIEMARRTAVSQQLPNISFVQADSLPALLASPDMPSHIRQFDVIISRRGPVELGGAGTHGGKTGNDLVHPQSKGEPFACLE